MKRLVFVCYEVLLTVWEEAQESSLDSETRARIVGVEAQMAKFDFFLESPWVL